MTSEEALSLRVGDVVELDRTFGKKAGWVRAVIVRTVYVEHRELGDIYLVSMRRDGLNRNGKKHSSRIVSTKFLRRPPHYDPTTSNIFADYLQERGFHEAAEVLRTAFPIVRSDGSGGPLS